MITTRKLILLSLGLALFFSGPAFATFPVSISGAISWDLVGDPDNDVIKVDLAGLLGLPSGTDVHLDGVDYAVILTTVAPSWADEPRINISEQQSGALLGILGPFGSATTVTSAFFSGGIDVTGTATNGGALVRGGVVELEFYETGFDDFPGSPDAFYLSGSTLKFDIKPVPEPACIGLILAGIGMLCLRRRK